MMSFRSKAVTLIAAFIALLPLSACNMFAPEASVVTLIAQRDLQQTQIAGHRDTATASSERLRVTLEAAQTVVSSAQIQSTRISATMMANGTAIVDIRFITPEVSSGDQTPLTSPVGDAQIAIIPVQGGAQGNIALQPPTPTPPPIQINPAITVQPTADPNGPSLTNIVVAERVGADDCAIDPKTRFVETIEQIYVVATAANIAQGTRLSARFLRENIEQIRYDWSPGFNIVRGCIWFRMPASDVALASGNWAVALEVNGQQVGVPVPFQITTGDESVMSDG